MAIIQKDPFGVFGAPRLAQLDFESLGREQGYRVSWEKAMYCPRRVNNDLDKHDMNCPVCESRFGIIYFDKQLVDPHGKDLRALVTGIPQQQIYRAEGYTDAGSAYISLPPRMTPNYGDRIILLESRIRVSQVINRRGTNSPYETIDNLKYKAILPSEGGGIVYCIDSNGVVYTDVSLTSTGDLQWGATRPADDVVFSIMYYRRPAYVVIDLPHIVRDNLRERDDNNEDLGTQALCKLDFLIRDESLGA